MNSLTSQKIRRNILEVVMSVFTLIYLFPVLNLIFSSLKDKGELMRNPVGIPSAPTLENYVVAFSRLNYIRTFTNTLIICVCSIVFIVIVGALAAYPISRFNLMLNKIMYIFFLSTIMIPAQAIMIPLVRLFYRVHLVNNHLSLIIFYLSANVPFAIFLFTGFIKTIPRELDEAATIDGCGPIRSFLMVIFPLMKPAVATVIILNIMTIWNDFMMPMVLLQNKAMRTLTPSVFDFFEEFTAQWNYAFAASVLIMIPGILMFLALQKQFIAGMVAGGVKS